MQPQSIEEHTDMTNLQLPEYLELYCGKTQTPPAHSTVLKQHCQRLLSSGPTAAPTALRGKTHHINSPCNHQLRGKKGHKHRPAVPAR
jgi:hypothetical protein